MKRFHIGAGPWNTQNQNAHVHTVLAHARTHVMIVVKNGGIAPPGRILVFSYLFDCFVEDISVIDCATDEQDYVYGQESEEYVEHHDCSGSMTCVNSSVTGCPNRSFCPVALLVPLS